MTFVKEIDFEKALIDLLSSSYGWSKDVLYYKTEAELLRNWADILFASNRSIDRLDKYPLTEGEMQQILEQISSLKTPLRLNDFINGKSVTIVRDNPEDMAHFGKEVSLEIFDRQQVAAGSNCYQIARQPRFSAKTSLLPERRGDFMLLINGMPLIHVELKRSGIPVSQACYQIEKYAHEGVFSGLFSLVQIFVAMNPDETLYFANPGPEGRFNADYYFHWADFNNEPITDWKRIASTLLSIPMAHQLIGMYTVADNSDGVLKVMRPYQYRAVSKIHDLVRKNHWGEGNQLGGYIWHTTGSGKTLTSFKAAQLIAHSREADKVIFLIDRIELGTQSAGEYRSFAGETESIQETEDTGVLINKLVSTDPGNTLIVTSIQKMSRVNDAEEDGLRQADLDVICAKRLVFIVDECHRSSFGSMMQNIKRTFPNALFFGFSGTPIQIENKKKGNTTADVFGPELHRYSIADGIRDKNVLGFDPDKVLTFKERDMRQAIALEQAKAPSIDAVFIDPVKTRIFNRFMHEIPMAGETLPDGRYEKGIEDYLLQSGQYRSDAHQKMVVQDIVENWSIVSQGKKFHGLLATSSISEAVSYYHRFKADAPTLSVTALFDPNIDNNEGGIAKEEALLEIISDYNARYGQSFTITTYGQMKKDIQKRLAHKRPYERIERSPEEQIDLLIVVDQMLTGYDSKWLNVLYLDKMMHYENIIQAFSRTNRLFGPEKPFGSIKYYRAPYSMERNIKAAVKLYSGDRPLGMFVIKLDKNLENMNALFLQIKNLFEQAKIEDFERLPDQIAERQLFAKLFKQYNEHLEAAKVQGFVWEKSEYKFFDDKGQILGEVNHQLDLRTYRILLLRYRELFSETTSGGGTKELPPYDLDGYLTTIDSDVIDADYMNSRFEKYKKALELGHSEEILSAKQELHRSFASLTQEEQKYANLFLHDIESGDVKGEEGKTFRDYINDYVHRAKNDQIHRLAEVLGLNEVLLREMMALRLDDSSIDEYGRLQRLKNTVDGGRASAYFRAIHGGDLRPRKIKEKVDRLLRDFIIGGGFEIPSPSAADTPRQYADPSEEDMELPMAGEDVGSYGSGRSDN